MKGSYDSFSSAKVTKTGAFRRLKKCCFENYSPLNSLLANQGETRILVVGLQGSVHQKAFRRDPKREVLSRYLF